MELIKSKWVWVPLMIVVVIFSARIVLSYSATVRDGNALASIHYNERTTLVDGMNLQTVSPQQGVLVGIYQQNGKQIHLRAQRSGKKSWFQRAKDPDGGGYHIAACYYDEQKLPVFASEGCMNIGEQDVIFSSNTEAVELARKASQTLANTPIPPSLIPQRDALIALTETR